MTSRREYDEGIKQPSAPPLPTLGKRAYVRVVVPASVMVYAGLRKAGSTGAAARCVVSDISAGGVALTVTEGLRFDLPRPGEEVRLDLDYDGGEAVTRGVVVRASARELSLAFPPATTDAELNEGLVALIARLMTRRVEHLDRRRFDGALRARLLHERFVGAGPLEVCVQTAAPAWWQLVFLDYLVVWSGGSPLTTGTLDRSAAAQHAMEPLRVPAHVTWHETPWESLRRVGGLIAARCAAAQPDFAAGFHSIAATLNSNG